MKGKVRKVVEQNFQGNFQVNVTCIIGFFLLVFFRSMLHDGFLPFSLVSLTELCSFWYGLKDLFTLHKLVDKVILDKQNWLILRIKVIIIYHALLTNPDKLFFN